MNPFKSNKNKASKKSPKAKGKSVGSARVSDNKAKTSVSVTAIATATIPASDSASKGAVGFGSLNNGNGNDTLEEVNAKDSSDKEVEGEGEVKTDPQAPKEKPEDGEGFTWQWYKDNWQKVYTVEKETDPAVIAKRLKDIEYGKSLPCYKNYIQQVKKEVRVEMREGKKCPSTPKFKRKFSRRNWDGQIKAWKIALHDWEPVGVAIEPAEAAGDQDKTAQDESNQ